jgi:hypothetical protein
VLSHHGRRRGCRALGLPGEVSAVYDEGLSNLQWGDRLIARTLG